MIAAIRLYELLRGAATATLPEGKALGTEGPIA